MRENSPSRGGSTVSPRSAANCASSSASSVGQVASAPRPRSRTTRSPRRPVRNDGTPSPRSRINAPCWVPGLHFDRLLTVERLERRAWCRARPARSTPACGGPESSPWRSNVGVGPRRARSRTGRRRTPPRGAAGPRRASRSRWPSSMPAGTSTSSVRVPCDAPVAPARLARVGHDLSRARARLARRGGHDLAEQRAPHLAHLARALARRAAFRVRARRAAPVPPHVSHSTGMRSSTRLADAEHDLVRASARSTISASGPRGGPLAPRRRAERVAAEERVEQVVEPERRRRRSRRLRAGTGRRRCRTCRSGGGARDRAASRTRC